MRKTGCYGKNDWAVNFEWPTAQDLLQMVKNNIAVKVRELKYKKNTSNGGGYFGGFQLILSDGTSSPVFTATGQDAQGLQTVAVPDFSLVKRINGTNQTDWICILSFGKKDGTEITKLQLSSSSHGPEIVLADDEEIIGIYGSKEVSTLFSQLGFIVWKPPKL